MEYSYFLHNNQGRGGGKKTKSKMSTSADQIVEPLDLKYMARFQDISFGEDGKTIILLTRNGGGNRNCAEVEENRWSTGIYKENIENGEDDVESCTGDDDDVYCNGCVQTKYFPSHPN